MLIGGPAAERTGGILWIGLLFGGLQIVTFVALLAPGIRGFHRGSTSMRSVLWITGTIYLLVFAAVMLVYRQEISQSNPTWTGVPRSTLLTLFVFSPVPCVFIATYILGFQKFIYQRP